MAIAGPSSSTEQQVDAPVAERSDGVVEDAKLERQVVRKMDSHLVTLLFALYLLSFLDRSNIGNAKIAGMQKDLHLTSAEYNWLLTIFYIPYAIFEVQIIFFKIFRPHYMATFVVFFWGAITTCQAATTSWAGMMVCRFLLGAVEAGIAGLVYLLSFFYLRNELGFRVGLFVAAAPLATCFAGALAYGITSGHAGIANWRLLFLVEGLPSVAIAAVVFFFLPDSPHEARFLTPTEKKIALARMLRQAGKSDRIGGLNWRNVADTLLDAKSWFTALMYFSCNVSYSSLPVFLPTILEEIGYSGVNAQGLSAPPYFISFLMTLATTWIADRTQQRGLMIVAMAILGGVGYVVLATTKATGSRYAGVYLAAAGIFPCIANILPWTMNNQGNDDRRGIGVVLLSIIGQCGPLLGTNIYTQDTAPRYVRGMSVCAAFMFFTAFLALGLRALLVLENKALNQKYGTLQEQKERALMGVGDESQQRAVENYGPMYRYVL